MRTAGVEVDLAIMDEAHKTVGDKKRLFSHLLFDENLPIRRHVFMTATERRFAGDDDAVVSMDDVAIYGDSIEFLSFKTALDQDLDTTKPHGKEREIKKLRKSGKMIREIMAQTELSKATVYRALDR